MNKFSTFDEVVAERKRLQEDLNRQKGYLRSEFVEIREKIQPVAKVLSFFARSGNNGQSTAGTLLKAGSNLGIDLLIGQKLRKAGWIARLVLPLVMKFTAHKTIDAVRK
ncbi:hypothetical protein WBG78_21570 [Chryseolinea sp. T2]|uniref:hypothetical protein n=1 Tax=Chryseolinea sp. T2 TaxID=3129255 RepID=UPI003077B5F4